MAHQAGHDGDINRLNETSYYAGAANFERSRLLLPRRVSHTLPPSDAIVPYLGETGFGDTVPLKDFNFDNSLISTLVERRRLETHTFHLPWGKVTIILQDVAYHLGLRAHGNPVGGCLRDFGRWYNTETWAMVEQLLGARPPVAAQQAAQRKESFTLKLVWLRDRVHQMPPTDDPETLRQYARCYIMLLIGRYLLTDKSNNLVHVRWLPLLRDFAECRALSWGSAVLAWTYQSLCLVAQRGVTDIASWLDCSSRVGISTRPGCCIIGFRSTGYDLMSLHGGCTMTLRFRPCARTGSVRRRSRVHGCRPF
ncbi:serine/threonine-protein phosphatase 7 long form homolog [Arachis ipaensis]|uniref:serine/threonine-protein phosphatase 7 long form homolog n=1 Tax=Arachis ipaensis TaxID=130454 RepID=UPI0007AFCEC4|nr:serine/threonine-protein phosphatase 7 long form homolog [Arachis ipaensis]XP_025637249.1 serine/threonine-protein phosphatase 7 long form homolog [Arachis hypogaea]